MYYASYVQMLTQQKMTQQTNRSVLDNYTDVAASWSTADVTMCGAAWLEFKA